MFSVARCRRVAERSLCITGTEPWALVAERPVARPPPGGRERDMPHSSLPDFEITVRELTNALCQYERRVCRARSEIDETVAKKWEAIAQSRAMMAEADGLLSQHDLQPTKGGFGSNGTIFRAESGPVSR